MGIYSLRTNFSTHLKVLLWVVLVIFVIGAIWSFGAAPLIQQQKQREVIIVVAEGKVHRSDFEAEWERIYEMAQQRGMKSPLEFANLKQMIVENMINSQKLIMVAEKEGIVITKKDVKEAKEEKILEALKLNRNAIMGDLDEKEEALDPRKDKAFLKILADNNMSIDSIIQDANANVSDLSIRAELAQKQIQAKAEAKTKELTKDDVKASYNNYTLNQIVVSEEKTTPEKAKENAQKAYDEIKGGADFNKVKEKYSNVKDLPNMDYNPYDMPWMLPTKVGESVQNLSEGKYTEPILANKAYYIVKVEKIKNEVPPKFDEKVINDRKEQIKQTIEQNIFATIQESMDDIKDINIKDPEFNGYYHCILAEREMNPETAKGEYTKALECFTEALKKDQQIGKEVIKSKMADVYFKTEDYKACNETLYQLLDGPNSSTDAYDLRALYGDSLVKVGEKDKAIEQYGEAALLNKTDANFQDQMADKLSELGAKTEAAAVRAEAERIREFEQKQQAEMMRQMEAEKAKEAAKAKEAKNKKDNKK